jgi:hypothetical protein
LALGIVSTVACSSQQPATSIRTEEPRAVEIAGVESICVGKLQNVTTGDPSVDEFLKTGFTIRAKYLDVTRDLHSLTLENDAKQRIEMNVLSDGVNYCEFKGVTDSSPPTSD